MWYGFAKRLHLPVRGYWWCLPFIQYSLHLYRESALSTLFGQPAHWLYVVQYRLFSNSHCLMMYGLLFGLRPPFTRCFIQPCDVAVWTLPGIHCGRLMLQWHCQKKCFGYHFGVRYWVVIDFHLWKKCIQNILSTAFKSGVYFFICYYFYNLLHLTIISLLMWQWIVWRAFFFPLCASQSWAFSHSSNRSMWHFTTQLYYNMINYNDVVFKSI